jgi:hypothetical protein
MVLQDVVLLLEGYGNASEYFICHTRDDLTNQSFSGLQNKDGVVPYEFKVRIALLPQHARYIALTPVPIA